MRAELSGRDRAAVGARVVLAALAAVAGLGSGGCLGETAIVLKIVGNPTIEGMFDTLFISVTQNVPGEEPARWMQELETGVLPLEIALLPGATISGGDVLITVYATGGEAIVASGTVGAVLEERRVTKISLPLAPLGCMDDPFEAAELVGGTLNPKLFFADLILCPEDDLDAPGIFVPYGFRVSFSTGYAEPMGSLVASFSCMSFGSEVYSEPAGDLALLAPTWIATQDATCYLFVSHEGGRNEIGFYGLGYTLYPDVPCTDDGLGTEYATIDPPFDDIVGGRHTACPAQDFWTLDVPPGAVLNAEVVPVSGEPSQFGVFMDCADTPSYDYAPGATFARTGPLANGPARLTCTVIVDGPPMAQFDLRIRAGDYASCVPDYFYGSVVDLGTLTGSEPPFTSCRPPGDFIGEPDLFVLNGTMGIGRLCIEVDPDWLPSAEEANLSLTVTGGPGELAYAETSAGYPQRACIGDAAGPVVLGDTLTATVDCYHTGDASIGCAQVYRIFVTAE